MGVYSQTLLLCLIAVCNILESDATCDTSKLIFCRWPDFSDPENVICADMTTYIKCMTDSDCITKEKEEGLVKALDTEQVNCGGAVNKRCSGEFPVSFGPVYNPYTFWNSQPLTEYCKSQNFKKQVGCLIDDERSVKTAELKSLIAEGDDYVSAVDTLCSNVLKLDSGCLTSIIQCLNTEAQAKKPTSSDFKAHKEYTCKLYESYGSCIEPKTGAATCNHLKTKEVLKTVHGKLVPPACAATTGAGATTGATTSLMYMPPPRGAGGALLVTSILLISSICVSMFL